MWRREKAKEGKRREGEKKEKGGDAREEERGSVAMRGCASEERSVARQVKDRQGQPTSDMQVGPTVITSQRPGLIHSKMDRPCGLKFFYLKKNY